MGPVVDSVLSLNGATPRVRIRRLAPAGGARVWAKAEHLNPGGAVKGRLCLAMIERAERDGTLWRRHGGRADIGAGANVSAAIREAEALGPDEHVVTIPCDTGERYFSLDEYFT